MSDQGERDVRDVDLAGKLTGELTAKGHIYQARVYYADTDFSGFVYHARYLEFLERGRTDYLRLAGIHHSALAALDEPLVWVVRRIEIEFLAPARMDEIITIETTTQDISGARITMVQTILRGATRLISAKVEAATVTLDGKPRRFPKDWQSRLKLNCDGV